MGRCFQDHGQRMHEKVEPLQKINQHNTYIYVSKNKNHRATGFRRDGNWVALLLRAVVVPLHLSVFNTVFSSSVEE